MIKEYCQQVGEQLYEFLRQFLQIFPELQQAPLFIAGQSYAGKYVPALGIQIHRHREREPKINLKVCLYGIITIRVLISTILSVSLERKYLPTYSVSLHH